MKHLIFVILCFISCESVGQIVISQPEMLYFFKGYSNKLEATSQNGVKEIDLVSPDFTFTKDEKGIYNAVATSDIGPAKIYMIDHKKRDTIDVFDVEIQQLPDPTLFLGAMESGEKVNKIENRLFAKYGPEVPLNVNFSILKGEVTLESGEKFFFTGNTLTNECQQALLKQKDNSKIIATIDVKGPDGIIRQITALWILGTFQ